jgi:hypothetical protein
MDQEQVGLRRAVAYLRVAHASDDSDNAIVAQRTTCEDIAERYRLTIVREYVDQGKPARLTQQTALRRLLAELEQHRDTAYVIVSDYARLGRDLQSLDDMIRRIHRCGAEVATITGMEAAERFTSTWLLDQVAKWATQPPDDVQAIPENSDELASKDQLSAAIQTIRRGQLDADQLDALAALVSIAGNATLPTPVAAAVFNVVDVCKRTMRTTDTTNE